MVLNFQQTLNTHFTAKYHKQNKILNKKYEIKPKEKKRPPLKFIHNKKRFNNYIYDEGA